MQSLSNTSSTEGCVTTTSDDAPFPMPKTFLKDLNILSDLVSNQNENSPNMADAEALTAHLIGDATPHYDRYNRNDSAGGEKWPDRFDHNEPDTELPTGCTPDLSCCNEQTAPAPVRDFPCCDQGTHTPNPAEGLTPGSVFLAIAHNSNITSLLPATWETSFDVWWDYTGGNLSMIRTAVDAVAYVHGTGVNLPDLLTYMDAAIVDIAQWTAGHHETPWTVHGFEARTLGAMLNGLDHIDPGAYTHPLHQLVRLALTTAPEQSITGVYGQLCSTGAMGHPAAPYTLAQLQHLAEGGTI